MLRFFGRIFKLFRLKILFARKSLYFHYAKDEENWWAPPYIKGKNNCETQWSNSSLLKLSTLWSGRIKWDLGNIIRLVQVWKIPCCPEFSSFQGLEFLFIGRVGLVEKYHTSVNCKLPPQDIKFWIDVNHFTFILYQYFRLPNLDSWLSNGNLWQINIYMFLLKQLFHYW